MADLPQPTVAIVIVHSNNYLEFVHEVSRPNILEKRQIEVPPIVPPGGGTNTTVKKTAAKYVNSVIKQCLRR